MTSLPFGCPALSFQANASAFGAFKKFNPGGYLLSHAASSAVPSAPRGLTSVFGMGTGVTLSTKPPENLSTLAGRALRIE